MSKGNKRSGGESSANAKRAKMENGSIFVRKSLAFIENWNAVRLLSTLHKQYLTWKVETMCKNALIPYRVK